MTLSSQTPASGDHAPHDADPAAMPGTSRDAPSLRAAPSPAELDGIAFERLLSAASPELALEIRAEGEAPAGRVVEGCSIVIRLELPEALNGAQGLVLTRNDEGVIRLLSNEAATLGALRWRRRLEVPRQDAAPDGGGPLAWLSFEGEGRHEVVAILTPSRSPRFDRHRLFARPFCAPAAAREDGMVPLPPIPAGALWDLVAEASARARLVVGGAVIGVEAASPGVADDVRQDD